MRVLVTDGDNRAALAITRSLGRAGHEVVVGDRHQPSLAQTSKYCVRRVVYPDPIRCSEEFLAALEATVRDQKIDVLMPVSDITTMLITAHRDRFEPGCVVPFAPSAAIEQAADKVGLMERAVRLGVPTPRSVVVTSAAAIPEPPFPYPLVIKPHKSRLRTASGWMSTGVSYAANRDRLVLDLTSRSSHEFPVMLQERISGQGLGVFALYHQGSPVAMFSHRRLRERPPWGGVSVLSESAAMNPRVRDYATALLDDLGWRGVAMVEFKDDVRDGVPKLMEINGRFWGSLQLAIDAGVDFPALLVQSANGKPFPPQAPYRVGVRNRWLWGDFDSLLLQLFGRRRTGALPGSRIKAMLEFGRFFGRDLHYDNPKPHDVGPWFYETSRRFALAGGRRPAVSALVATPASKVLSTPASLPSTRLHGLVTADWAGIGLDEAGWNRLLGQSDTRSVFQTRPWARSWLESYRHRVEPLFVTVADRSGIQGVAPLVLERRSAHERVVRFLGDGRADYCDVLTGADKPAVVRTMFEALRDHDDWDVLELNNVPAYSRTPALLRKAAQRAGYPCTVDDQFVCPTLMIEGHEDSAREIYNKQSLRRRENYFQREGGLRYRDLSSAKDVEPYLDAFFTQHLARWESCGTSLFAQEENREFYRNLTGALDGTGHLLFTVIELGGKPLAFHYGFQYDGVMTWYKPAFDPEQAAHSPGIVMVRHLIGYALANQRRELDFTVGDEPFKRRFTNCTRKTVQIRVFRTSGRYLMERSKRTLASTVRYIAR